MSTKVGVGLGFIGFCLLVILVWCLGSINKINETERGVVMRAGALVDVATPGYKIVLWPIYSVDKLNIQQDTNVFPNVNAYTRDSQQVTMNVSVTYKLKSDDDSLKSFYRNFKTMDSFLSKILRRNITDSMQVVLGKFSARETISDRQKFNVAYFEALSASMDKQPVDIISVQVEDIIYPKDYLSRINQQMETEVELETEKTRADIVRTTAQGRADAQYAEAEAQAKATKIKAEAEAGAIRETGLAEIEIIREKNRALNEAKTEAIIEMSKVEKWDGKLPVTILGGESTPMINLSK